MAGGHKHRFSICYKNFGTKIRMKPKKSALVSIKLSELAAMLPELLEKKIAEEKGNQIIVDGEKAGISKVFGKAELKQALVLKNIKASESAKQAIEKSQGRLELESFAQQKTAKQEKKQETEKREEAGT